MNADLELVKVLKGMCELENIEVRYFVTFEARDLTNGGNTKIYQAVLRTDQYDGMKVLSFRVKPPENEQGLCIEKEWLWEGNSPRSWNGLGSAIWEVHGGSKCLKP